MPKKSETRAASARAAAAPRRQAAGFKHCRSGFTLVDLLMVVLISALLASVAAPAMGRLTDHMALRSALQSLHVDLAFARGEAIMRHGYISMCPSRDGDTCDDFDWQIGWIVFEDPERLGVPAHPESILRIQGPISVRMTISGNAPIRRHIGFNALGVTRARNGALLMGTLRLCHAKLNEGRALVINRSGRIRQTSVNCGV
ncbi:MAG: GspH/FimT family pseudopilin [Thioalkalivibrionaceae bacterium]